MKRAMPIIALLAMALGYAAWRHATTPPVTEESRFLMDTLVSISIPAKDTAGIRKDIDGAFDEMDRINNLLSNHLPGSDISRINSRAGEGTVGVSRETIAVLKASKRYWRLTDGAFDVTVGPLVDLWGIGTDRERVPKSSEIRRALALIGSKDIMIDEGARTVGLSRKGMKLDLGAIGKGYAVDAGLRVLKDHGIKAAMVNAGSSSIAVMGPRPGGKPWRIGMADPDSEGGLTGVLSLDNGFVGTSSFTQRYFIRNGVRYHHILDPRTGYPARGSKSVTVVAKSGMESDAMSTSLFVMGAKGAEKSVRFVKGLEYSVMGDKGGSIRTDGFPLDDEGGGKR